MMKGMKSRLLLIMAAAVLLFTGLLWWGHGHPHNQSSKNKSKDSAQAEAESFDKKQHSIDDPASIWVVVNKNRPLSPATYAPTDLTNISGGQTLRSEATMALGELFAAAKAAGYSVLAQSGYRSYQTQVAVYNREVQAFGQTKADTESAKPGYSEHQTGWAVDIQTQGCLEDCFGNTKAAHWLNEHAYAYGFILRYPANKVSVTGYRSEPWHYRYVGKALANELQTKNQTMEEFFNLPAVGTP